MKRVERRGTLDSSASLRVNNLTQTQSQKVSQPTLSLAPSQTSYSQSYSQSQSSQSQSQSQPQSGRSRAPPVRTDTVVVDAERHASDPSRSSRSPSHGSSNYHASVPPVSAAARHPSLASQAHYVTPHTQSQSQSQQHHAAQSRRAPTPPFITAIPSREQHEARHAPDPNARRTAASTAGAGADSDDDLLEEDDRDRRSAAGGRYAHSESYARQHVGERDERDELADDADGDADGDADAEADGSGGGSVDADAEDADILDAVDATMKVEE